MIYLKRTDFESTTGFFKEKQLIFYVTIHCRRNQFFFLLPLFQVKYHITKKPPLIMWNELLVVSGQPVSLCE